jgi:hypothetical protein
VVAREEVIGWVVTVDDGMGWVSWGVVGEGIGWVSWGVVEEGMGWVSWGVVELTTFMGVMDGVGRKKTVVLVGLLVGAGVGRNAAEVIDVTTLAGEMEGVGLNVVLVDDPVGTVGTGVGLNELLDTTFAGEVTGVTLSFAGVAVGVGGRVAVELSTGGVGSF